MNKILMPVVLLLILTACNKEKKIMEDNKLEIENYLVSKNLKAESTESGLYYIVTREGNGEHPASTNSVTVDYKGYYSDGEQFDSSYDSGESITFPLNRVIAGWTEGIPKFSKGGAGVLLIPSHLGYGANPGNGIRSNAVLIFDVELHDF